jgi:hypothetical protein
VQTTAESIALSLSTIVVIYATAMISPDLDDEEYTVGKYSTRDDLTINLLT